MKFAAIHVASLLLVAATTWAFDPIVRDESVPNLDHSSDRDLQFVSVRSLELIEIVPGGAYKVKDLVNGDTILRAVPSFNINAAVSGYIGSMRFGYNGNPNFLIDNSAPYTFCANPFNACGGLGYGIHSVSATPCLLPNGFGCLGTPYTVTFTISAPPTAPPVQPPVAPPVKPPVAPPVTPPVAPPVSPPVTPPVTPSAYEIDLQLIGIPPADQTFFTDAKARWKQIVKGDVRDINTTGVPGSPDPVFKDCTLPAVVDDLHICAVYSAIDGPNTVLAYAGPYYSRSSSSIPINGYMAFDTADINNLKADGGFGFSIMHEMGHILGLGTVWKNKGIANSTTSPCSYSGVQATKEYNAITGCSQIPLENDQGGAGTVCTHWDDSCLGREFMTGFYDAGVKNPLSRITVGSLEDLGYVVDYSTADAYTTADVTQSCRCNRRLRGEERTIMDMFHGETFPVGGNNSGRRRISEEVKAVAMEAGHEYLAYNSLNAPDTDPRGATFVADQTVSVLVRDTDGSIYSVIVRNDGAV